MCAAAVAGAAAAPATATHTFGCGPLGLLPCTHPAYVPPPDPGGDENAGIPLPPPGDKLAGFNSDYSAGWDARLAPTEEFNLAAAAGANAHRINFAWSLVEPDPPVGGARRYAGAYLAEVDRRYGEMRARGIKPIMILHSAPQWAQPRMLGMPVCLADCRRWWEPAPERVADWAAFAQMAARRYPAAAFEVWNEPNLNRFYRPEPDAGRYVALYRAAYFAIKDVLPGAQVLTGGINGKGKTVSGQGISAREFLGAIYRYGLKQAADARISVHIYPRSEDLGTGSGYAAQWDAIADVMEANGDAAREVWVTETGISTSPESRQGDDDGPQGTVATPEMQRDVIRRAYNRMITMEQNGRLRVRAVLFHTLMDDDHYSNEHPERGFGALVADLGRTPKPVFCWMVANEPAGAPPRSHPDC